MIELLIAFGAGAAASTWLHLKGRKRSKTKQAPPVVLAPQSSARGPLSGSARVAAIFISFPPVLSARLFEEFGPEDVQRITLEISRLPSVSPQQREQVLSEFCASLGIAPDRLEEAASEEPALIAKALMLLFHLPAISA